MKFSVVDFEKLTKKVGVVKEASVKDEGARALLEAAKSPVRETKSNNGFTFTYHIVEKLVNLVNHP